MSKFRPTAQQVWWSINGRQLAALNSGDLVPLFQHKDIRLIIAQDYCGYDLPPYELRADNSGLVFKAASDAVAELKTQGRLLLLNEGERPVRHGYYQWKMGPAFTDPQVHAAVMERVQEDQLYEMRRYIFNEIEHEILAEQGEEVLRRYVARCQEEGVDPRVEEITKAG